MISGVSTDGKYVTLLECTETESTWAWGPTISPGTSVFRAQYVLVGVRLKRIEDLRLARLIVEYAHLDEWVNTNGFQIDIARDLKSAVVQYKLPDKIEAANLDEYRVAVGFRCKWPTRSRIQKEATLRQTAYVGLEPVGKMLFPELLAIEFRLATFFGLAIMQAVGPIAITGWTKRKEIVEIFYQPISTPTGSNTLLPTDMLFTLSETNGRLAFFLGNWLRKADELAPIYYLYFVAVNSSGTYLEHKFLSIAQAVESYHRRRVGNAIFPKAEHRRRKKLIINAVPAEDKDWLKQRLQYSNEPTLRSRLEDLCRIHQLALEGVISNTRSFIGNVADTRNYLTHYDERLKNKRAEGLDLYLLTQRLKMLLELCLLRELGFDETATAALVKRNRRYQQEAAIDRQ
jgi:hypothetical protein